MIKGYITKLRPVERDDMVLIARWRNSPEVSEFLFENDPISAARQERWFEQLQSSNDKYYFVIETSSGKSIGLVYLFNVDWRNRHADWGFYIGDLAHRMGGYAVEAEFLLLQYAFYHLNLYRLYCRSFALNTKVLSMHRKFGFVEEGRLREHVYRNGRFEDVIIMGITRQEFDQNAQKVISVVQRFGERGAKGGR